MNEEDPLGSAKMLAYLLMGFGIFVIVFAVWGLLL